MFNCSTITFTGHAIQRMFAREIKKDYVLSALNHGGIIMEYPDDQLYPSYLVLWFIERKPLHIVIAENKADNLFYVITAYIPSTKLWEPGFKKRKVT